MIWLAGLALGILALFTAGAVIRELSPLPALEGRTVSTAFADTADTPLGLGIAPVAAAHPGLSGVHPLQAGLDAFAARSLLAQAATRSIDAQYYIWHGDLTGSLLFAELRSAADRGVRVRLLLDDNNTSGLDPIAAALDAHPNIEVRLFNPFAIRSPRLIGFLTDFARLNRRMHNKSFTVDNQATIVGGRNRRRIFRRGGGRPVRRSRHARSRLGRAAGLAAIRCLLGERIGLSRRSHRAFPPSGPHG